MSEPDNRILCGYTGHYRFFCTPENHIGEKSGFLSSPAEFTTSEGAKVKYGRVIKERIACVYDRTALTLKVGDIIRIIMRPSTGIWRGEHILENGVIGKQGWFPFTHVEFIDAPPQLSSD